MSQRRSKRRVQEVSDDDEDSRVQSSPVKTRRTTRNGSAADATPAGRKGKAKAIPIDRDDEDEDDALESEDEQLNSMSQQVAYRPELERGDDGYIAGSIVRVKITGFMTYDHVQFQPGPHLNMILGPNGTGKSSIAAAIAIGLGFHPKVMGRAHDVRSYVKQGTEVAEIEIELKGRRRQRNPVIWRKFGRDSDKSEWKLNGKVSTRKAVQDLIKSFGVQADNLCSFLPQDKVADFAKMNPVTVLKETMRAAGDPNLSQWHEDLVANGSSAQDLERILTSKTQKRDTLRRQVDELEPDVRNYERRLDLQRQLNLAEVELQAAQWKEFGLSVTRHREAAKKVKARLQRMEDKHEPMKELQEAQAKKEKKAKHTRERLESESRTEGGRMESAIHKHRTALQGADDVVGKLKSVTQEAKAHQRKINEEKEAIAKQEAILSSPDQDKQAIRNEMDTKLKARQKVGSDRRAVDVQKNKDQQELERVQRDLSEINIRMNHLSNEEAKLTNVETQRQEEVFKDEPSIRFAVKWIEANQDKLEGRVFYPPIISLNVPDQRYAWQIEAMMNNATRKSFICQNQHDYKQLMKLNRTRATTQQGQSFEVRLNLATLTPGNQDTPNISQERLAAVGLDGFAIDFIEAEPVVRTFLCQTAGFQQNAVSLRPHSEINPDRVLGLQIRNWYSSTHFSRAIQSRYGKRDMQITTNKRVEPRYLAKTADHDEIKRVSDEMADLRRRMRSLEQPQAKIKLDIEQSKNKLDALTDELMQNDSAITGLRKELNRFDVARQTLARHQQRLKVLQDMPSPEQKRRELRAQIERHALEGLDAWRSYKTATDSMLRAGANVSAIEQVAQERRDIIADLADEFSELSDQTKRAKERQTEQLAAVRSLLDQLPHDQQEEAKRTRISTDKSIDDARAEVQDLRAQLDLSLNVDGNTVARYNRLKAELNEKEEDVSRTENELQTLTSRLKRVTDRFNPALDALVEETSAKFSAAFERIGCTGEVRVARVEGNYAEWGIEILVSYRDGQDLEVLTASRQSGGERSLATVTYLMSLSEMARTPFSLVDEINQGMDARAERSVHNQMVKVTCAGGDKSGQYFLITPKLLTDLEYHENMRVLIVNNGTWLPDPTQKNFGALASRLAQYKQSLVSAR